MIYKIKGPVTSALEEEIKRELRRYGIVVWLDKSGVYSDYVDALIIRHKQNEFPFPVVAFRGSFMEMILALAPFENGIDKESLLIHMPGHTEDTIRKTPILELYAAGYRYRRALDTLVRETAAGRVDPDKLESFIKDKLTDLAGADVWLEKESSRICEGISDYLESLTLEWTVDGILGKEQSLKEKFPEPKSIEILIAHLYRKTGMDQKFVSFFLGNETPAFSNISEAFAAWLMCVEYVHDLTVSPHLNSLKPLKSLSAPICKTCLKLVDYFRTRHPETYAGYAMIAEGHLQDEIEAIAPENLGRIDTFKREEERILEAAIHSLLNGDWRKALDWAKFRVKTGSFWLEKDPMHRLVWLLIDGAAKLGDMIKTSGRPLSQSNNLEDALQYYTSQGYKIDQAHRHFGQQQLKLLDPQMPHFAQLLEASDKLRVLYRKWADELALDFTAICERDGFIPEKHLQQREIYDQVVAPLTRQNKKIGYFLIDAFRFEMAAELAETLQGAGVSLTLKGRCCELPSITSIGMNVLAPVVKSGKLTLAGGEGFNGFKAGEYTVRKPDERIRAMGDKSIDNVSSGRKQTRGLMLSDVCNRSLQSLKKSCAGADLIVIHSREIDDAGEANMGLAGFEMILRQIRTAWNHLRGIGIEEFVFTADHGFLLKDRTINEIPYGSKRDPDRRFILSAEPRMEDGMVRVSLNALGYEGQEGYLLFRRDTAVFQTGKAADTFVHGGNSLQERVIPVLTVSHRLGAHISETRYHVWAKPMPGILGFSRVQVCIKTTPNSQLQITATRHITFAIRVPNRPDIQVTIKEVTGASLENQVCRIKVDSEPVEVLFDLKSSRDERVRLEIFHPDGIENIEPFVCEGYFNASGGFRHEKSDDDITPDVQEWQNSFEDISVRRVFTHLSEYGSITEAELNQILGSPRSVRRFSLSFEEYVRKLPFPIRIETTPGGKRYVKD